MGEIARQKLQAPAPGDGALEALVTSGDLAALSPAQRVEYYTRLCQSLGLNPLTQPFAYLRLNGRLVLYAQKNCTEQLRQQRGISVVVEETRIENGCAIVRARATDKDGRTDSDIGVVPVEGLQGEALANALMKAVTKAKRRVTLSLAGLGWLDESEIDSTPGRGVAVDVTTGEVVEEGPRSETGGEATEEDLAGGKIVHRQEHDFRESARKLLIQNLQEAMTAAGIEKERAADWLAENFDGKRSVKELTIHELAEAVRKASA